MTIDDAWILFVLVYRLTSDSRSNVNYQASHPQQQTLTKKQHDPSKDYRPRKGSNVDHNQKENIFASLRQASTNLNVI